MFKKIFRLAFPERPEEKLDALIEKIKMSRRQTDPFQFIQLLCLFICSVMAKLKIILARCSISLTPMATEPSALVSFST